MPTFWALRKGQVLVPASKAAAMEMERIPEGKAVKVEAVQPRNGKFHRLMWSLYTYVASALNDGPSNKHWTPEDVSIHVKLATGHTKPIKLAGQTYYVPESISYAAMDQIAFSAFAEAAMQYIRDDLCPWIMDSEHAPQIAAIVGAIHE